MVKYVLKSHRAYIQGIKNLHDQINNLKNGSEKIGEDITSYVKREFLAYCNNLSAREEEKVTNCYVSLTWSTIGEYFISIRINEIGGKQVASEDCSSIPFNPEYLNAVKLFGDINQENYGAIMSVRF